MTREEIERLDGRELDYYVTRRVVGHDARWHAAEHDKGLCPICFPQWSRDMNLAWSVAQHMAALGYDFEVFELGLAANYQDAVWCDVAFGRTRADLARNRYACDSIPKAICRAALIALENEDGGSNDA